MQQRGRGVNIFKNFRVFYSPPHTSLDRWSKLHRGRLIFLSLMVVGIFSNSQLKDINKFIWGCGEQVWLIEPRRRIQNFVVDDLKKKLKN